MAEHKTKLLIIGSGPAGYTAAIYGARAGLEPLLVSGPQPGGQLTLTTDVENFPGFPQAVNGTELTDLMRQQAENVKARLVTDIITNVDFSSRPFICQGDSGDTYIADSVIIATGASARWLGLESEDKFRGFGVSACATCDGFFYRGRNVAVIGGGNTAVDEALYLTNFAASVTLIHRRDSLRADKAMQQKVQNNPKVHILWDSVVTSFNGSNQPPALTGLTVKNVKTDQESELKVDGAFIAIGHHPNTELFKGKLDMTPEGYIITRPGTSKTSVEGVFAAGDVQDSTYRQAVVAAGSGCIAALDAEKFLTA